MILVKNQNKKLNFKTIIYIVLCNVFIVLFSFSAFAGWMKEGEKYRYLDDTTGQYVNSKWVQTNIGYYFLDNNGYMCVGWYQIVGDYYYFGQNGIMQTGFITTDGNTYYLSANDGKMIKGWIEVNNDGVIDYYYFTDNGTMAVGWLKMSDGWHYFDEGKAIINTWAKIQSYWYRFDEKGVIKTGWYQNGDKYYYLNPQNGRMVTGFVQDDSGATYYLRLEDGTLVINETVTINGIKYTFDEKGKLKEDNQSVNMQSIINNTFNSLENMNSSSEIIVAIGVSPGTSNSQAGINSSELYVNKNIPIQVGDTTGPN